MLQHLEEERRIPVLPVYVDSPSATEVTEIYRRHAEEERRRDATPDPGWQEPAQHLADPILPHHGGVQAAERSARARDHRRRLRVWQPEAGSCITCSTAFPIRARPFCWWDSRRRGRAAGRCRTAPRPSRCSGSRCRCGRGWRRSTVSRRMPISGEILRWLGGFRRPPRTTYLVHGEPESARALAQAITTRYGWTVRVAQDGERVEIT